jgi:hypothetical protein
MNKPWQFKKGNELHKLGSKGNKGKHPNPLLAELNRSRKGKPFTKEHREKIGLSRIGKPNLAVRGEKNIHWKGGIYPINKKIRLSLEYRLWRESVLTRDNYECIWCGSKENLHVDHIKQFAFYPELRFAIDNGRTLCVPCHKTTDTYCKNKKL